MQTRPSHSNRLTAVFRLIRRAIEFSRQHRGRLVRKQGMTKAMARYHYVTEKAGMTGESAPHSLRYWYTTEHLRRLKTDGVARRQAAAAVSTWLGHGDERGTWVELVYGRDPKNEAMRDGDKILDAA
jgi:hypothetical protein